MAEPVEPPALSKSVVAKKKMLGLSLKARLALSALTLIFLILPLLGFTLSAAFEKHLLSSIKNELSAHNYAILAVAEVEQQQLSMPFQLAEPLFNTPQSGLYAVISALDEDSDVDSNANTVINSKRDRILWRSNSLLGIELPPLQQPNQLASADFQQVSLAEQHYFVFSFAVSFSELDGEFPIVVHIIKDDDGFEQLASEFQYQLAYGLGLLMLFLLALLSVWLLWTLKPLRQLKQEISQIESGQQEQLTGRYPQELQAVTGQLNLLLATEKQQRLRYRNALSDLAHSLKTPLAVMHTQSDLSAESLQQLAKINQMIEHQLKRAQTAGQSAWHLGVNVAEVINKLHGSLVKIYHDKALEIRLVVDERAVFQGDESDLLEMLGNLLDNACKAAKTAIICRVSLDAEQTLVIDIEDDGVGISKQQQSIILARGGRADTYQQGHGIGLAIVNDLVASYHGRLIIASSKALGGAKFSLQFTVKKS